MNILVLNRKVILFFKVNSIPIKIYQQSKFNFKTKNNRLILISLMSKKKIQ